MKYAVYEQYKPTGIEWLGAVPMHWEIWKVAHGFQMTGSGTTPPPDNPDWYDGDVCWVTTSELRETVITDTEKKISHAALKSFSALKVFPKGALAIAMYGATIGRLGIFGVAAATNQACGVLFGQKTFDTKFVFYWLQAFREQIILLASGGGQPNISQEKVRSIRIACPFIDEQQTIARFLDANTAQIDELIAKKRQLIDKLKEKRQALIARTVTRGLPPEAAKAAGLEPNPEMQNVEEGWIGEMPAHWKAKKGGHLGRLIGSVAPAEEDIAEDDDGVPYAKVDDLNFLDSSLRLNSTKVRLKCPPPLWKDIILFPKRGAAIFTNKVALAQCVIFDSNLMGWKIYKESDPKFFAYCLIARRLDDLADVSTVPQINNKHISPAKFPHPPKFEQEAIVAFLDSATTRTDRLVGTVEGAITRLTEYRQALITSAVTGKIDVRGWA